MAASPEVRGRAREALGEVVTLRRRIATDGRKLYRSWRKRIARTTFAPSALNFAHYLALRRHDLRPLQRKLMGLGISSLGRLESRVLVSLDAVIVALAALAGDAACPCRSPSRGALLSRRGLSLGSRRRNLRALAPRSRRAGSW